MPLYEYVCGACERRFEELIRVGQADPQQCPRCEHVGVSRVFSTFAAVTASSSIPPAPCGEAAASGCASGGCPYAGS